MSLGCGSCYDVYFKIDPVCSVIYVGIQKQGFFTFQTNSEAHTSYVGEKLGFDGLEAMAMTDYINAQICGDPKTYHPSGLKPDIFIEIEDKND